MNHLGTMYATKRRRRNSKSVRVPAKESQTKSNPSKRHRERLNAELDMLASLLPFEQSVLSKLDKLSILRLSVSYLRTKGYFQAVFRHHQEKDRKSQELGPTTREFRYHESMMDGDTILQTLNGFMLIITCEGEVFYASHTVATYLGFHQSDICHQSVYELVHSEDREELQRQLMWNSQLPADHSDLSCQEVLSPENCHHLERNFTVRFRCLLDNTSGFLRLDIRGRVKVLHGQNQKVENPPLALFAVCTPFGPPSLLDMPHKDSMFKSKHKLNLSLVSMDLRGKQLLGYSDADLANKGGYDLVHFDDLAYLANAHQELLKTGASGLIAYRLLTKDFKWQWLQSSARLVYKNSKPDFILCTHRPLLEEEGRDLFGKRTMDFKVTYLDGGLGPVTDRNGLLTEGDTVLNCQKHRKYKSQKKELLTCRKKKLLNNSYLEDPGYPNMYSYSTENMNGLSSYGSSTPSMSQNFFTAIDNSRFLTPENFLHYRHYYSDYTPHATQYSPSNGFLDVTSATRGCFPQTYPDNNHFSKDSKFYPCQLNTTKFNGDPASFMQQVGSKPSCCDGYPSADQSSQIRSCLVSASGQDIRPILPTFDRDHKLNFGLSPLPGSMTPDCILKSRVTGVSNHTREPSQFLKEEKTYSDSSQPSIVSAFSCDTRQSVLKWGAALPRPCGSTTPAIFDAKFPRYTATPENHSKPPNDHLYNGSTFCKGAGAFPKTSSPHTSVCPTVAKVTGFIPHSGTPVYTAEVGQEAWQVDHLNPWRSHLPSLG
ncbi:uncharacterized protein LOC143258390 isoform X2 [Tachypleus tridentatus]|uniref:uncharacterized protein LOC143258390 isoform X2 n=1 Tax=Tachypleus tridentatus TaxID=6853 RepID=UPI003FCF26E9